MTIKLVFICSTIITWINSTDASYSSTERAIINWQSILQNGDRDKTSVFAIKVLPTTAIMRMIRELGYQQNFPLMAVKIRLWMTLDQRTIWSAGVRYPTILWKVENYLVSSWPSTQGEFKCTSTDRRWYQRANQEVNRMTKRLEKCFSNRWKWSNFPSMTNGGNYSHKINSAKIPM